MTKLLYCILIGYQLYQKYCNYGDILSLVSVYSAFDLKSSSTYTTLDEKYI